MNSKDIFTELNPSQRAAVECIEGPVMVIAGAGSGKTRVLTYRIAHLINSGADPFQILALTFTNKAAKEMKDRVIELVGNTDARNVWMGTFHSIFARILREEAHRMGYPHNYSIYDTDDSKSVLRSIIKEQQLDNKVYAPGYVHHRISSAKTSLISAEDYNNNPEIQSEDRAAGKPKLGLIYTLYKNRCFKAAAMDFDDLLFNTYKLLDQYPEVLLKYQNKFKYILVDEYQDTNHVQYLILKKLAAKNENICVVGDDAQSIYGFRGANIQNILSFQSDYPDFKTFKLEQNYRSTKTIVSAANSIIVNNKDQIFKEIWTENSEGEKIPVIKALSDNEEGMLIANSIFEHKMNHQLANTAFAILYRTNAQSRSFEEALRKLNIPYRIYGGLSFYKRKEIKDLLAYFRLVINNNDEEALMRTINYPARGIGKTTIEKIIVTADAQNKSCWDVLKDLPNNDLDFNQGIKTKVDQFITMIGSFAVQLKTKNAFDLAKHIANSSGIAKDLYEDKSPEGLSRYENIEELLNAIKDFTERERVAEENLDNSLPEYRTLDEFMHEVSLLTEEENGDKEDNNRVALMTIHSAKGLEFPYVYIVGLEENLFPSIQSINSRTDLEEERRLFYVALTRAKEKVTLSYAENRYRWGNLIFCDPSRFIEEVDKKHLNIIARRVAAKKPVLWDDNFEPQKKEKTFVSTLAENLRGKKLKKISTVSTSTQVPQGEPNDNDQIQVGMEVEHLRFGKGKVLSIESQGANRKATVFFATVGNKQLLLQYAKLKIVRD